MEPQQETSHDILESLLQELVEHEEDFSFYISLCLRLLARSPQHGWDVKAFMRGLEPEDMAAPRDPAKLRTNPKFLESEWLMGKYSILLEAFDEAVTSRHISTAAPKDTTLTGYDLRILWKIVNAHYSSYLSQTRAGVLPVRLRGLWEKIIRLKTSQVIFKITLIGMRVCLNYGTSAASWRIGVKIWRSSQTLVYVFLNTSPGPWMICVLSFRNRLRDRSGAGCSPPAGVAPGVPYPRE